MANINGNVVTKTGLNLHLDPKANFIHRQAEVIRDLKFNNVIFRSDYNHKTGRFTKALKIIPKKFIVIAGLHPFYPNKEKY